MKKKFTVIVNVNLEYTFNVETEEQAIEKVCNAELPKEYIEDSFEVVKVIKEQGE